MNFSLEHASIVSTGWFIKLLLRRQKKRRYDKGLENLFKFYLPITDQWFIVDNSEKESNIIAKGTKDDKIVKRNDIWSLLKRKYDERQKTIK